MVNKIRKGKKVEVLYNGNNIICKVLKKDGITFQTYAPIVYMNGEIHMEKMSLNCNDVVKVF